MLLEYWLLWHTHIPLPQSTTESNLAQIGAPLVRSSFTMLAPRRHVRMITRLQKLLRQLAAVLVNAHSPLGLILRCWCQNRPILACPCYKAEKYVILILALHCASCLATLPLAPRRLDGPRRSAVAGLQTAGWLGRVEVKVGGLP